MHGFFFDPAWLSSLRDHTPVGAGVWIITLVGAVVIVGIPVVAAVVFLVNTFGWGGFIACWPIWAILSILFSSSSKN